MENKLPIIKTSDINLASALLCLGYDVTGIDNVNPKKVSFIFMDSPQLATDMSNYWSGNVRVDPKELSNYRRELLTRVHEA